jgi:hypothetical protein
MAAESGLEYLLAESPFGSLEDMISGSLDLIRFIGIERN